VRRAEYLAPGWTEAREERGTSLVVLCCLALFSFGLAADTSIGTWLGAAGTQSIATSAALGLPLLVPAGWYLVTGGGVRRLPVPFLAMAGFVAWSAVSLLWGQPFEFSQSVVNVVSRFELLIFVWLSFQIVRTERDLRAVLLGYLLGCSLLVALVWRNRLTGVFAFWERYSADGFDPNDMALYLALGIPMATYLALAGRPGRHAGKLALLYLPLALSGIALSGSRTGMIAAGLALVGVVLWLARRSVTAWALTLTLVVAGGMVLLPSIPAELVARLLSVGDEIGGGSLGDRTQIWRAGLAVFPHHPVVGVGAGCFGDAVSPYIHERIVAHSTPLSVGVELGVVGLVVFFGAFGVAMWDARRSGRNEKALVWCLVMTWFLGIQALTWEYRKPTWLLLLVAIVAADLRPHPGARSSGESPPARRSG
jgi:O-antigen ligase